MSFVLFNPGVQPVFLPELLIDLLQSFLKIVLLIFLEIHNVEHSRGSVFFFFFFHSKKQILNTTAGDIHIKKDKRKREF